MTLFKVDYIIWQVNINFQYGPLYGGASVTLLNERPWLTLSLA